MPVYRKNMSAKLFSTQKQAAFAGKDLSRKGSVDEPIKDLVEFINSLDSYFTTSSCSGRIIVFADSPEAEVILIFFTYHLFKKLLKY